MPKEQSLNNIDKDAQDILGRARRQTWRLSELITATSANAAMHKMDKQICHCYLDSAPNVLNSFVNGINHDVEFASRFSPCRADDESGAYPPVPLRIHRRLFTLPDFALIFIHYK